ncbi:zinc-dependent metalloprotease [Tessaracoccus rhinocerotis]|uniref:Zinc-dependent metalloprotease n=1 Tax=Tessaracoccus rhinocerotis TaxID=1689449 RepID=A0A553JYG1_9ACTN|nr:zinc-dependent metalloprotease [Tessaracoccus rhinocerotis]TRY17495.1 zinc-dependent metalloprotease [Tessaracoccus rhinocerotis]
MSGGDTSGPTPGGFGGFDFEELRKLLEQLGMSGAGDIDFSKLMEQFSRAQAAGGVGFGFTNADRDPDAAWRTTITSAKQLTQGLGPDPALTSSESHAIVDAERLAQSWLSAKTSFPETGVPPETLRREDWLDETSAGWREIVEPIMNGLAEALGRGAMAEDEPELGALTSMLAPMMKQSASLIYRDRLKKVLAEVAGSTLTGTEIGINLLPRARVTILPSNVAEFTRDLEIPEADVLLYLVLREAARIRLFHHVTWLGPQLNALLAHYAREIVIDFEAISSELDPSSLEQFSLEDIVAVGERVRGSFFKPASTETQLEILGRLELLLALIEGWVDHVTFRATEAWMPNAGSLSEVVRRRRAAGGPTKDVFSNLLGLDLRPRVVRDAENLWAAIEHERGAEGRDAVWQHPDLLPTAGHLADPLSYGKETSAEPEQDELDVELRKLLGDSGN